MQARRGTTIVGIVLAVLGCGPPQPRDESTAQAHVAEQPRELEQARELESPPKHDPGVMPVTVVNPTHGTVEWLELATVDGSLRFVELAIGVLGSSDNGYWDVHDGKLALCPELESPGAEVFGIWPRDAWYVESRVVEQHERPEEVVRELRLMRLKDGHHFLPQQLEWWSMLLRGKGQWVTKSWAGGLLLGAGVFTYVKVVSGDERLMYDVQRTGPLVEVFEAASGDVFTIKQVNGALWVQRECGMYECSSPAPAKLPHAIDWEFGMHVPRGHALVSVIASATIEGNTKHHILHLGPDGWTLEQLPARPTGLWPSLFGSLWMGVGSELWYRSGLGAWREIGLPKGAGPITVAVTEDQTQLWIATSQGDETVVHATKAEPTQLPE